MKIAWLTPLSKASAIGGVTARIAEQLLPHAAIELWTSDRVDLHETSVPIVRYTVSDPFEHELRTYETVLFNFGDSYPFHRDVFNMSRRVPGIAVLHDFVMHHFFIGHHLEQPGKLESYHAAIHRLYGPAARAEAEAQRIPSFWETDRVVDYPFFEDALHNATGVIVHADFLAEKVRAVTDVPVRRLYLPAVQVPAQEPVIDAGPDEDFAGRAVLLTVGHVNPNKRVREVIEALGQNPDLAARVVYVVAGTLPPGGYPDEFRAAVAHNGLEDVVRFVGHQTTEELHRWLRRADVCVNLRHPVMEGASASLADQMMFGKTVVVSNAGVYREMPDDCVRKIDPGREADQLPAILRELLDDPQARRERGDRSSAYAHAHFAPERYAADLLDFANEAGSFTAMSAYTDRVGAAMRQIGITTGLSIVDTVSRESANLFGEPVSSPWKPGKRHRKMS